MKNYKETQNNILRTFIQKHVSKLACFQLLHMQILEKETINSLSANPTKWSNRLKQFDDKSRRIV